MFLIVILHNCDKTIKVTLIRNNRKQRFYEAWNNGH